MEGQKKEERKQAKLNIYVTMLLYAVLPLVLEAIIVASISILISKKELESTVHNYMIDMATELGKGIDRLETNAASKGNLDIAVMQDLLEDIQIADMSTSYAYVVDGHTSTMLYHPTAEKIGQPVENAAIKMLIGDIKKGKHPEPELLEYEFKGAIKYAGYYVSEGEQFILIVTADKKDAMSAVSLMNKTIAIMTFFIIMMFAVIALLVAIKIARPLESTAKAISELADGEVNTPYQAKSNIKEIRQIIYSTQDLKEQLNTIVGGIQDEMENLTTNLTSVRTSVNLCSDASGTITSTVEEIARGASCMAESVQNIVGKMAEISNEIDDVAQLSTEAKDSTDRVENVSNEAMKNLQKLIVANKEASSTADEVVRGITHSDTAVAKINEVTNAITEIASQTNMLSLNASIEAARAGEAGRGFAVVAQEIQQLAAQSNASAQQIQSIIAGIVNLSKENTILAEKIKTSVKNEEAVLLSVNDSFTEVKKTVDETNANVKSITDKVSIVNGAKGIIVDELSTLSAISEEDAASTEETNASIEELVANIETIRGETELVNGMAEKTNDVVSYFKLKV